MSIRTHITQFKEGEIVPVYHFGIPDQMKVIGHDHEKNLVKLQYLERPFGEDKKSLLTLNQMAEKCANHKPPGTFR